LTIRVSVQTVGNVLQRYGLPPAPKRKRTTTWPVFIRTHLALVAGTEFFTAKVVTLRGAGDLFITNIAESEFSAHTAVSRSLRIEIQSVGRPNYD